MQPESSGRGAVRALVALVAMGALAGVYLVMRPPLGARVEYLALIEYPVAVALVAFIVWRAVRRSRPKAEPMAAPLYRHEQIVRTLSDPDAAALERALTSWVETGGDAARAADILARSHAADPARRDVERARILPLLAEADSRKARARLLRSYLSGVQGD